MPKIEIEVEVLNDGSQFSSEEEGVLVMHIIMFLLFAYFLGVSAYKLWVDFQHNEATETPIGLLVTGLVLEMCHIGFNIIHLWVYSYNGYGVIGFNVLAVMN